MTYDAIVVGSGPNGLSAAITLARAGLSVLVREGADTIGGGTRTKELTLPGFRHDVCSAIHPLGVGSPFFTRLPLGEHGLRWIQPDIALGHPFPDAPPALLHIDIDATAATLGEDGDAYRSLVSPFARRWPVLAPEILGPMFHVPAHPLLLGRFGLKALRASDTLIRKQFRGARARALFSGMAAHAMVPLSRAGTAAFGLVLAASGHHDGWPLAAGGSRSITDALASYLRTLGGVIETGAPVHSLGALPGARVVVLDLTARQVLRVGGDALPSRYREALSRFRYGPGAYKVDWALDGPVPWRDPELLRCGTVHLGPTHDVIEASDAAAWRGETPETPFVLLAQQSLFDASRAPAGRHTLWGYCHVPFGSTEDMLPRVEAQIERFAPGFRDRVLARRAMTTVDLEAHNPNLVGGDIGGGANTLDQVFWRPARRFLPYATPVRGLYICSASTPPGGGVHGMNGHHAAMAALQALGAKR